MSPAGTPRRWVPGLRALRLLWRMAPHLALVGLGLAATALLGADATLRRQVLGTGLFLLGWSLLRGLLVEVLSPVRPALRLVRLDDARAAQVSMAGRALLFALLLTEGGRWLVRSAGGSPAVAAALRIARDGALVLFGATALAAGGVLAGLRRRAGAGLLGALATMATRVIFPFAVVTALVLVVARGLGYLPLAAFLLRNALLTAGILLVATGVSHWLRAGLREVIAIGRAGAAPGTESEPSPASVGLERLGVGTIQALVLVGTALAVLGAWDLTPARVADALDAPVVGGGVLTWGRVLGGFARMAVVIVVGRVLKTVLTFLVFPKAEVDVGVRYAILAILRYVVIAIVAVLALDALGVDTGSLAWFLGAAGIGLGHGLQDVLGNFFSGHVMLVERPIRVGDLVEVGQTTGTVEAIRMRGTLLRTGNNTTVLVPNRQMMAERLTNLSHGLAYALVEVKVTVEHGTDPAKVERVLLALAREHTSVVGEPSPVVRIVELAPTGLVFALYAQTWRVRDRGGVASDLRYAILAAFEREGLVIPRPTPAVSIAANVPAPATPPSTKS
ncbi:MAG: mechanosensitive ion channel [Planctomycetia bacterium]|nr:mechanosensitive ion channel [Planctomycetia bacterium]